MSTHNTIVSVTQKLTADLVEAAHLKAEISRLETDLKVVAARIVKASSVKDQYQIDAGKITVSARTNRTIDVEVLESTDSKLAEVVVEPKVSWSKWDAAVKLGLVNADSAALVTESLGEPFLSFSLSTVR